MPKKVDYLLAVGSEHAVRYDSGEWFQCDGTGRVIGRARLNADECAELVQTGRLRLKMALTEHATVYRLLESS